MKGFGPITCPLPVPGVSGNIVNSMSELETEEAQRSVPKPHLVNV